MDTSNGMDNTNLQTQAEPAIHFGHLGVIALSIFVLLGAAYMEKPQLFSFKKSDNLVADANVPHYYPYVTPAADLPQPQVLGASTNQGPQIISDDGTVQSVDMGQVLAASTDVQLSPESIKVNSVPDSDAAIQKYFAAIDSTENGPLDNGAFESALTSQNQTQINQQAAKMNAIVSSLEKLSVPNSLVKLHQLIIIQYNSAIALLQNFSNADTNTDLVGNYLQEFMKSQQDLNDENIAVAQKLGAKDPNAFLYVDTQGKPLTTQAPIVQAEGSVAAQANTSQSSSDAINYTDNTDYGQ